MKRSRSDFELVIKLFEAGKYNYTRKDLNALKAQIWRSRVSSKMKKVLKVLGASIGIGFSFMSVSYLQNNNNSQVVMADENNGHTQAEDEAFDKAAMRKSYRANVYVTVVDQNGHKLYDHSYAGYVIEAGMLHSGTTPLKSVHVNNPSLPTGYKWIDDPNEIQQMPGGRPQYNFVLRCRKLSAVSHETSNFSVSHGTVARVKGVIYNKGSEAHQALNSSNLSKGSKGSKGSKSSNPSKGSKSSKGSNGSNVSHETNGLKGKGVKNTNELLFVSGLGACLLVAVSLIGGGFYSIFKKK